MIRFGTGRCAALCWAEFAGPVLAADPILPTAAPDMLLDLTSSADVQQAQGDWRYHDVDIVAERFPAPGADGQPGTTLHSTYTISPQAGTREFDDQAWEKLRPETLMQRRGGGRFSFNWYRLHIQIPTSCCPHSSGWRRTGIAAPLMPYSRTRI